MGAAEAAARRPRGDSGGPTPQASAARIRLQGSGFDFSIRLGKGPGKPTAGGAQWDEVQRPERQAMTDYTGDALLRIDVPVLLDGFREGRSIQPELDQILALCRGSEAARPADFIASGPIPYSGLRCVMEPPEWGDDPPSHRLAGSGVLVRQALTLKLVEFVDPDNISFVQRSDGPGSGKGAKAKTTVTTKANETLLQVSTRVYGNPSMAQEIGALNGIRDVRKKLKAGRVLRLPITANLGRA